jgi:SAM-dependent MidA family methyltransferase
MRGRKEESTWRENLGAIHPKIQRAKQAVGNAELIEIIRAEIGANGPIPFARFMELALYHPQHGYYASGRANIGRRGDFFTNVSVGPLFGKLLAAQFAEIWEKLRRPRDLKIVEQGAHDGIFAADALSTLRQSASDCFAATSYCIVEPFPIWRERQQENLREFAEKTSWVASIDDMEPFVGIHFSNELFDSLPVHLIVSGGVANGATVWNEKFVDLEHGLSAGAPCGVELRCQNAPFEFVTSTVSRPDLLPHHLGFFPAGFETEVNLAAPKLMSEIAKLSRGLILTIDYGFPRAEFYSLYRNQGTLQVRAKQKKLASPFEQIGLADISAHVEWSSLAEAAQSSGATPIGFTDQHHFLTGIISKFFPDADFDPSEKRALQTLLHPEMLGRSFQVLVLGKDFHETLAGFQFGRDPIATLGV